jgi:hypothetical protein
MSVWTALFLTVASVSRMGFLASLGIEIALNSYRWEAITLRIRLICFFTLIFSPLLLLPVIWSKVS